MQLHGTTSFIEMQNPESKLLGAFGDSLTSIMLSLHRNAARVFKTTAVTV